MNAIKRAAELISAATGTTVAPCRVRAMIRAGAPWGAVRENGARATFDIYPAIFENYYGVKFSEAKK